MKKLFTLICLIIIGSTAVYSQVIINEVLYDPSNSSLDGDANGDGVYEQEGDAFIEFVNSGNAYEDMSGWEIWDDSASGSMQFKIPNGTILAPNGALVVFGGGTPTGDFGGAIVMVDTSSNGMSLQNSGEVIVVKDSFANIVLVFDSDALSSNPNESYTRNPDITGAFEQHGNNKPRLFSPGRTVDSMPFAVELHLQGIIDFTTPTGGSSGKGIHVVADSAISDMSNYGLGTAGNGGGTDGREYNYSSASVSAGDDILVVRDSQAMADYFAECFTEFEHVFVDMNSAINQNGDDAIELFLGQIAIEVYGDVDVDGTGEPWEYSDAWAYKTDTGWMAAAISCTDDTENTYYSDCRYPICSDLQLSSISVEGEGAVSTITINDGTLQMIATIGPAYAEDTTVSWSVNDTTLATIDNQGVLSAKKDGVVTVTATANDGGGTSGSADITISNQVSSVGNIDGELISLHPNPVTSKLYIESSRNIDEVIIYGLSGQEVKHIKGIVNSLDMTDLSKGMYYVQLHSEGQMTTVKIVKD
jgi:hypothetical protein